MLCFACGDSFGGGLRFKSGIRIFFGSLRRNDVERDAVVGVHVTRDRLFDLVCGDAHVTFVLGVEEIGVVIVERKFGEALRAEERGLTNAHGIIAESVL